MKIPTATALIVLMPLRLSTPVIFSFCLLISGAICHSDQYEYPDQFPPEYLVENPTTIPKKAPASYAKLAIIIDDLGNSLRSGLDAIALPGPVSFAVMPHRKHSQTLAERAGRLGKDVLLHAPMSTQNGRKLGAGALRQELGEKAFKDKLRFALHSIPYIKGMNNHMGSLLTTQQKPMTWVMQVLEQEQLFFVDSRTHAQSVAFISAQQHGLKSAQRDVFLDNEIDLEHIHQQFKKALAIAQQYGSAIIIGHPYDESIYYLKHVLPQLKQSQVKLYSISDLLTEGVSTRSHGARASAPAHAPNLDQLLLQLTTKKPPAQSVKPVY